MIDIVHVVTVFHFFLECRNYTNSYKYETVYITNPTVMKILNGVEQLSTYDNTKIHDSSFQIHCLY